MDGWMDGWTDGRMDGWMDGWRIIRLSVHLQLNHRTRSQSRQKRQVESWKECDGDK